MLLIKEEKRANNPRNLFLSETQLKIDLMPENDGNTYGIRIRVLFFTDILLFSIAIDISLKSKGPKTKEFIFSFDYYSGIKHIKQQDIKCERNYLGATLYEYQSLNPLLFLDSSQEIFINLFRFENSLAFLNSFQL